jgi:hypothetical protein
VKTFIEDKKILTPQENTPSSFSEYKKKIHQINTDKKINDSFVSMSYPSDYEVIEYTENSSIVLTPSLSQSNLPSIIGIYLSDIPNITDEKDFFYILEEL